MLCKCVTVPPGIKLILISRLKFILFCSLNIFVKSLSAIIPTEIPRNTPFRVFQLLLLLLSFLNLTNQSTNFMDVLLIYILDLADLIVI